MKLLIKKFSVKRSGTVYGPSSVIELPDADGQRLLETSPKVFELIEVIEEPKKTAPKKAERAEAVETEAKPASKKRRKKADADALPDVNVEALVK